MRTAIVSDIHGNRTAFGAVLADLREASPDLILHGGDLADAGSSPIEILDQIRDLGWPGVLGNTDEMLCKPESLADFASQSPNLTSLFQVVEEMADAVRETLGQERLTWLSRLPLRQTVDDVALLHAAPESLWRAPLPEASNFELETVYATLGRAVVVYAHIHRSFVRNVLGMTVANTGSVSLSHDGDPRAAYLLLDDAKPTIRRVAYDLDKELKILKSSGLPHADWIANILISARPQMP